MSATGTYFFLDFSFHIGGHNECRTCGHTGSDHCTHKYCHKNLHATEARAKTMESKFQVVSTELKVIFKRTHIKFNISIQGYLVNR